MVGTPTRYQCSERRRNSSPRLTPTHTGEWLSVMPGYPATRRESCLKRQSRQTPKYRTATISSASCTSETRNGLRPLRRLKKQSKPTRIGPTITTTSGLRSAAPVALRTPETPSKGRSRSTRVTTPGLRQSWTSWSFGKASKRIPESAEKTVRDIRRATRRHHSAEEKIRIVLEGLRGEDSIAELCRKEGINQNLYYRWSKEFLEAGKKRLAGDTAREATSDEVKELKAEARQLKETLAELLIENRLLKKSVLGDGEDAS